MPLPNPDVPPNVPAIIVPSDHRMELELAPGEKWWGGRVVDASRMPFDRDAKFRRSLHAADEGAGNQSQPLLLSTAGRYVWNDGPFEFEFTEGRLRLSRAVSDWKIGSGGS